MIEYVDIDMLAPATYNPRIISEKQFEELQESIKEIGFVIPIIANRKRKTIIAGHQRTKAAKALGIKSVPVFWCKEIEVGDEIQFNQFHNGCDIFRERCARVKEDYDPGFHEIEVGGIDVDPSGKAVAISQICRLIMKYGNLFCAIVIGRDIVMHDDYIAACKSLNITANISVLPLIHATDSVSLGNSPKKAMLSNAIRTSARKRLARKNIREQFNR